MRKARHILFKCLRSLPAYGYLLLSTFAMAQPAIDEVKFRLGSIDPVMSKQALDQVCHELLSDPDSVEGALCFLKENGLRALRIRQQYEEIAQVCLLAAHSAADSTEDVEFFMQNRIRALLKLQKTKEALANSRSLFNVSRLESTSTALLLVAECVASNHVADYDIVNRFKHEQFLLASMQNDLVSDNSIMNSIPISDNAGAAQLEKAKSLRAKGNLLLLAGRSKEARELFEQQFDSVQSDRKKAVAIDVARAIKAENGGIGQANRWLVNHYTAP